MKFYLIGGFVRSLLTGERTKDIDICAVGFTYKELLEFLLHNGAQVVLPAPEYHHLFVAANTPELMPDDSNTTTWKMGVIRAKINGEMIDFSLARTELDSDYTQDNVVPTTVINTPDVTIEQDMARRDFTMNTMAIHVKFDEIASWIDFNKRGVYFTILDHIIDPYSGRQHIEEKMIHPVGSCIQRFTADPTRILRALKFSLRLDFQLSRYMQETLWDYQDFLCEVYSKKINPDRSCNELMQIFKQAPAWRVIAEFYCYIPLSLLRIIFCDNRISLYPTLRQK